MAQQKTEGMLSPYRVLDLTDEKGLLCGKLLGDLGADVIKIERPGGDPARSIGPFYHDEADPNKSLFWFAFNTSKRGITLDIETADGRDIFKRLIKTTDFIIESFPPGYMKKLGLAYADLEKVNPKIIMVSITPFGPAGPYKDYKAPDIVAWAIGGMMYLCGDPDRPPVRVSHHSQAYLHAAAEAAVGATAALYYREITGEGQQVDVSIQEAVAQSVCFFEWDMAKFIGQRRGKAFEYASPDRGGMMTTRRRVTRQWRCKDGEVSWFFWGGEGAKRYNSMFVEWMEEEGMADDFIKEFDWDTFALTTASQETIDRLSAPVARFFMTHTKWDLYEEAVKRGIQLSPGGVTMADARNNVQLASRGYWVEVPHPELGATIIYPGAFTHASEAPPRISRRAPLIGEHNHEIYRKELGLSDKELVILKEAKVI